MLIVKQDKTRKEKDGQIFVELTSHRDITNIADCNRIGYWCDKAHLSHFIMECATCFTQKELKNILKINRNNIFIDKENLHNAYKNGNADNREMLEDLLGKEFFLNNIIERIKTFEDAVDELGDEHPLVIQYREIYDNFLDGAKASNSSDVLAYLKLRIICTALNDGWEPQFTDDELRYCPLFRLYTQAELDNMDDSIKQERQIIDTADYVTEYAGFGFLYLKDAPSEYLSGIYSRLCLQSKDLAVYCGKQFIELWADLNLIRKR